MRHCSAVTVVLVPLLGAAAQAADRSLSETVTNAFETVVIDATKAASKATAAAKDALAPETRKSKRAKNAETSGAKDGGNKDGGKTNGDKKSGAAKDAAKTEPEPTQEAAGKSEKHIETQAGDQAPADKGTAAAPAAKADDGTKPADPKSDTPAGTAAEKPPVPTEWPAVDVELAKARCTQLLKGIDAVTVPEAPFRKGDCGTMAPVRLISIGKNPEVALSPPPVVTCDMVVALTKWIKEEVQPAARRHLGSEVIRMESMSDYSCRMAYGRIGNKLSEHGKANALDIRAFTTRKGDQAVVLTDWGETRRDVLKQLVAAKVAAEKAAAAKAAAEKAAKERMKIAEAASKGHVTALPRKTIAEGLPKDGSNPPSLAVPASMTKEGELDAKPSNLGGPKDAVARKDEKKDRKRRSREEAALLAALPPEEAAKVKAPGPTTPSARFLHEVHASGCRIFGTTLGPEANEAHRNHFHVDMAERKVRKICD